MTAHFVWLPDIFWEQTLLPHVPLTPRRQSANSFWHPPDRLPFDAAEHEDSSQC